MSCGRGYNCGHCPRSWVDIHNLSVGEQLPFIAQCLIGQAPVHTQMLGLRDAKGVVHLYSIPESVLGGGYGRLGKFYCFTRFSISNLSLF